MRSEKTETINSYQCKVFTANNFERVTRTRIEHLSEEDRKAFEEGQSSRRNILGGVFNFLESSASSKSSNTTASASAATPTGRSNEKSSPVRDPFVHFH